MESSLLHPVANPNRTLAAADRIGTLTGRPRRRLQRLACEFRKLEGAVDRVRRLLDYAGSLPPLPEEARVPGNRVAGCAAQVWVTAGIDEDGRMRFGADSDSEIARGFCGCLVVALDGALPEEVMEVAPEDVAEVSVAGGKGRASSRVNVWHNVLFTMKRRTEETLVERGMRATSERFAPALGVGIDGDPGGIGSLTEAQLCADFIEERLQTFQWNF